jgi:hypothetical protein
VISTLTRLELFKNPKKISFSQDDWENRLSQAEVARAMKVSSGLLSDIVKDKKDLRSEI